MQVKHHKTTILIAAATLLLAVVGCHNDGSALTYQDAIGVRFTFNPTVSINVSGDLTISDLAPGSASDSNIITIASGTNSPTGYNLYSTVGSTANNYADLKSNSSGKTKFTNLTETKTTLANFSDNTWGYSYCITTNDCDRDSTKWVSGSAGSVTTGYSGLPIYDSSDSAAGVLLASSDSATDTELKFKIGAKASSNQASGTYTNVINFIGVANPVPISIGDLIYLQDFAALTSSDKTAVIDSMIPETTYTLQDKRDFQPYTIAKLKDGKVWMTKNLNLAGGTEITSTLSDVPDDYILPVTLGFQTGNKLPESSSRTFNGNARVYNSGNTACGEEMPCCSYYSWEAATAGSGDGVTARNTDAPYSICPSGWHLPNTRMLVTDADSNFRALMIALGGSDKTATYNTSTSPTGETISNALQPSPLNFTLSGYYSSELNEGGIAGRYWSSTSWGSQYNSQILYFYDSTVQSTAGTDHMIGLAVRCVLTN